MMKNEIEYMHGKLSRVRTEDDLAERLKEEEESSGNTSEDEKSKKEQKETQNKLNEKEIVKKADIIDKKDKDSSKQ